MSSTPAPSPDRARVRPAEDLTLLRGILDAAPARVCVVSRDRRYLYVNREFAAFAERSAEAIIGLPTRELVGEAVAARLDPHAERALAGEVVELEGWIDYQRNGRRYIAWTFTPFAGADGRVEAFILFMRDFTEAKQREEEAATGSAHLRAILEGVADGVNILGPDSRLVLANRGFLRMYGFTEKLAVPGTPLADFVRHRLRRAEHYPGENPTEAEEALVAARVATIMGAPAGRFEETRPDGSVIAVRRERLADGTLLNTYRDVTAERQAARARRARGEALRRNERLSAIASLLAGVAHEINNPLAVVAAQALLLAEEAEGTPLAERAEKVRLAAERCGRIVASLLATARQQPPRRDRVEVPRAIEAGLELAPETAPEAAAQIVLEIAPGLPAIRGDADQLAHLVANLVGNARAALATMAPPPDAPLIRIGLAQEGAWLVLRVADNGPGIPEALRERVFAAFFTTKAEGAGTGVGLALCRTIAKAHGGSVTAEETPGGGATFVVRLPLPVGA
jgi:PAS domain S-box-containing protein